MNDPKYLTGPITNTSSGEVIPQDEPIFFFRARDKFALTALEFYWELVSDTGDQEHLEAIRQRIEEFYAFKENYPERMKRPDTDLKHQGRFGLGEETGEEVGSIAARLLKHEDPDVRKVAASALRQQPDRG